jgi:predicted AlkP superfamily pyrophosphatase or phosphodiesterase
MPPRLQELNIKEKSMKKFLAVALSLGLVGVTLPVRTQAQNSPTEPTFKHVLLVSIDGMHAVDFLNCSKGISGVNGGAPYARIWRNWA